MIRMTGKSSSSPPGPTTLMTTLSGYTKATITSESQAALNSISHFINDLYYDTFQRSFLATIKAQGLYDVADQDFDPNDGDQYDQQLFQEKQSFVYSVLVTSLQTDKGRELAKEFEGDARTIISKLHHYHTQSNVAQHEVVTLSTSITNLNLTDSWKGTIRQFLSHFKEKLRLLDSLVPDTDKIPETERITFLQRAVHQSHDLRQIHVLDSVWRSKTGSTGKLTFEVYYDLLQNAAYQNDLNKTVGQKQMKAFISHQVDHFDESDHEFGEDNMNNSEEDDPSSNSTFQSSFNSTEPKKPTKVFIPYQLWGEFPEAGKQMIIDYNKNIKIASPRPHFNGGNTKQKLLWHNLTQSPSKFIFMRMTILLTVHPQKLLLKPWYMNVYLMVEWTHLILIMSCQLSRPRLETHLKNHQEKSTPIKDLVLLEQINLPTTWLIGEPMEA